MTNPPQICVDKDKKIRPIDVSRASCAEEAIPREFDI